MDSIQLQNKRHDQNRNPFQTLFLNDSKRVSIVTEVTQPNSYYSFLS